MKSINMQTLNLPSYDVRTRIEGSQAMIFDAQRGKYVALTPEEWVRQHFINYLIHHRGYPGGLISNEVELRLGDKRVRCDSVVYDRRLRARMIIEYKAPDVALTRKVFDQIAVYNIMLHADWIVVSNGIRHICCKVDYENKKWTLAEEIPEYKEVTK